jgi:serine/threonine protein kinase
VRARRRSKPAITVRMAGDEVPGYRDLQEIGHGGFGVVYRAHQQSTDRVVAVKVLATPADPGPVRELRLTGPLTGHPNVVTLLDSGLTASGRPFLAMEYYERGSLGDLVATAGPLPLADVLRIGVKISAALAAAHHLGIVHRDVKPHNILISRYDEPALADFGAAGAQGTSHASTRTDALTPCHTAPEVLRGQPTSQASDIYSLGTTLFHLLAGRPPYQSDGGGIAGLILRVLDDEQPTLARADVPPQVVAVIQRAMAKAPGDRYPDAGALAAALAGLQAELGHPVTEMAPLPTAEPHPTAPAQPPTREAAPAPTGGSTTDHTVRIRARPVSWRRHRWPALAATIAASVAVFAPLAIWLPHTATSQPAAAVARPSDRARAASHRANPGGSSVPPRVSSRSGQPMPVGDLPGWRQVFTEDFATPVPVGSFPGPTYQGKWSVYQDGSADSSGHGEYYPSRVLSVENGVLTVHVHTEHGLHMVAAALPRLPGVAGSQDYNHFGQAYGRYSVRFRADAVPGYQTLSVLWPDSDRWRSDGAITFPAGNLTGHISGYLDHASGRGGQDAYDAMVPLTGWHTATTEWSPNRVMFLLDDQIVGASTREVPHQPLHQVLQTDTCNDCRIPDAAAGNIQIDWVVIYARV